MPHAPMNVGPKHLLAMIKEICEKNNTDQIHESVIYNEAWHRNLCTMDQAMRFLPRLCTAKLLRKNGIRGSSYTLLKKD